MFNFRYFESNCIKKQWQALGFPQLGICKRDFWKMSNFNKVSTLMYNMYLVICWILNSTTGFWTLIPTKLGFWIAVGIHFTHCSNFLKNLEVLLKRHFSGIQTIVQAIKKRSLIRDSVASGGFRFNVSGRWPTLHTATLLNLLWLTPKATIHPTNQSSDKVNGWLWWDFLEVVRFHLNEVKRLELYPF